MVAMKSGASADLSDEEEFGRAYNHRVVARFFPYILPHKGLVALSILAMLLYTATQVAVPWIIKIGIDEYVAVGDFGGLTWIVALFIGNALLNWGANFTQEFTIVRVGQAVLFKLRSDMFAHLQRLSLSYYDKVEVGRVMSRVQGDVWQIQEFLGVAVMTLGELLSLVGIILALMALNLKLGLIVMAVWPLLVLMVAFWQPKARRSFSGVRRAISTVNGALNENITGVRVVQSMNRQGRNLDQFDAKNRENLKQSLSATRLSAGLLPPVDTLTAVSIGFAIFFGAGMVSSGALEVGALIAFILYIQRFFDPIRSLTMQYTALQRAMASGIRVFELLDTQPDQADVADAKEFPSLRGDVEMRDVSYSYVSGQDVLSHVNMHVRPGETAAIVGPTGAGKTTVASLLARFYDVPPERGAIFIDGKDVRKETRRSLVSQISMVLQEPFLFSGSVRENIVYNQKGVSNEQMIEAAEAVGAHEFILKLEDGYDTYLHERGVDLSLGQRQLISFARAIVTDPRILILDEATASIDSQTEAVIQKALSRLLRGRTAIVIAHRLSTIRGADKIIVMNHGKVEETGTHEQLMDKNGLYAHLYHMNHAALDEPITATVNGSRS